MVSKKSYQVCHKRGICLLLIALLIICNKKTASANVTVPPQPVKIINGERFENKTLRLLENGEIVYAPTENSVIDRNGGIHSIEIKPQYDEVGKIKKYSGFKITVLNGSRTLLESFYDNSYTLGQLALTTREGSIVGVANMKQQISKDKSRSFTIAIESAIREVNHIRLGSELISTNKGYYMVDIVSQKLVVYSLDINFNVLRTYTIDRYVDYKPHIAVDPQGLPHVSYYNAKENSLKYARLEGADFRTYTLEKPESGFDSSLDVDDRDVIIASYFYLNSYNKGIILYRIPLDSISPVESMNRCLFNRRKDENIGWVPTVSSNGKDIAVSVYNKSSNRTEVYLAGKDYISKGNDFTPEWLEPWMEKKKELSLYGEIGYNYLSWSTAVSTNFDNLAGVTLPPGNYKLEPTLVEEVGFGGEYGKTSFVFNYMRNMVVDKAKARDETAGKVVEHFASKIGVEDIVGYGKTLELHTRKGLLKGEYTQDSVTRNFRTEYTDIDVDIFEKKGYFWGLGYRNYATPQPIVVSQNLNVIEQYVTNVDFNIYSLLFGYSNLNYLRKYENRYNGFYTDAKGYLGIATLSLEEKPKAELILPLAGAARVNADIGYIIFHRFQGLKYLSSFLKLGANIDWSYIGASEEKEENQTNITATVNISRHDYLVGAFVKAGLTF